MISLAIITNVPIAGTTPIRHDIVALVTWIGTVVTITMEDQTSTILEETLEDQTNTILEASVVMTSTILDIAIRSLDHALTMENVDDEALKKLLESP